MSPVSMCKRLLDGIPRWVVLPLLRVLLLDMVSLLFAYIVGQETFWVPRLKVSEMDLWSLGFVQLGRRKLPQVIPAVDMAFLQLLLRRH